MNMVLTVVVTSLINWAVPFIAAGLWVRFSKTGKDFYQQLLQVRGVVILSVVAIIVALAGAGTAGFTLLRLNTNLEALNHYGPGPNDGNTNYGSSFVKLTDPGDVNSVCPKDGQYAVGFELRAGQFSLACRPLGVSNSSSANAPSATQ